MAESSAARDTSQTLGNGSVAVAQGIDAFALATLRDQVSRAPDDDLVFSPYSIEATMAMVMAGARGKTADEIASALSFPLPYPALGRAFDAIDLSLSARATDAAQGFVVRPSDALWGQRDFVWQQPFLDTLAADFGAGVHLADFETAPDVARRSINAWVATSTDGLLPSLLPEGSVDSSTRFVLVDALALHARWESAFQDAGPGTFTLADGTTTSMPMMHRHGTSGATYTDASDYDAVTLAFDDPSSQSGASASMTIIVPKPGAWDGFEAKLDFRTMRASGDYELDLTMPAFSIDGATFSLKDTLEALGVHLAFGPNADFSGISSNPLQLEDVLHQARIDVDEQGVTAAAGTAAIGGVVSKPPPATFVVDRPFYLAVTDDVTGVLLFAGRFVHP